MSKSTKRLRAAILALAFAVLIAGNARGQESYKDKTIHFIVGYSAGGSFDAYTRLIARHFSKHVPGNPTTLVENMTGAGGIILANHMFTKAKPDGLTIGAWAAPLILQHIVGNEATKFDGRKFGWLGVPGPYDTVCTFSRESGIKTAQDWFAAKRNVKISSIGRGTSTFDVPSLAKVALGLPMQIIEGYKGGADARLAVESGEVDGYCGSWQTVKAPWRAALESGKIQPVLQMTLKTHPELKEVPLAINYAKTDEARLLLRVADNAHGAQFPYSVPPGMPSDRLQILQKAFMDTLRDPGLVAEANKSQLETDPTDGPTTTKKLSSLYDLSPSLVAKLKEILLPKK